MRALGREKAYAMMCALLALAGVTVAARAADGAPGMNHMPGMPGMADTANLRSKSEFAFGEPGRAERAQRTVRVTMTPDLRFKPSSLDVKAGETIRFIIRNKSAVEHDFTLGDAETEKAHRAEMADAAGRNGAMQHEAEPNAIMVRPGQAGTLTWTFSRAGNFEFDCNVPGHFEAGMKGTVAVSPR